MTPQSIKVGLAEVKLTEPLGVLQGTDNQFTFTTERYRERPLVITGPGAGPAVTAAGVFNDLLKLEQGRERRSAATDVGRVGTKVASGVVTVAFR